MADKKKPESLQKISQSCEDAENLLNNIEIKGKKERASAFIHREQTQERIYKGEKEGGEAWEESFEGNNKTIVAATGIAIFIAILIGGINEESKQRTSKQQEKSSSSTTAPLWKYNTALNTANQAILISEHEDAIQKLKEVLKMRLDQKTMNRGLLNNKVIQAQKAIKFLDQEGESKYFEQQDYGFQWYDDHAKNAYKVFFAYSKKCKKPMITFRYQQGKDGPVIRKTRKVPIAFTSTILIPYHENADVWLGVDSFRCN